MSLISLFDGVASHDGHRTTKHDLEPRSVWLSRDSRVHLHVLGVARVGGVAPVERAVHDDDAIDDAELKAQTKRQTKRPTNL